VPCPVALAAKGTTAQQVNLLA